MTPKERAAMQQALDFIDYFVFNGDNAAKAKSISTALREALAEQAEQEPVAIDGLARACNLAGIDYKDFLRIKAYLPIAAPVRTKDLTDDEILEITKRFALGIAFPVNGVTTPEMFARAVIAADREKNK